jgi:hypothetical protein
LGRSFRLVGFAVSYVTHYHLFDDRTSVILSKKPLGLGWGSMDKNSTAVWVEKGPCLNQEQPYNKGGLC